MYPHARDIARSTTKQPKVYFEEDEPTLFIEAKWSERELSPQLLYFSRRYAAASVQLVADLRQDRDEQGIAVRRAMDWLA